MPYLINKRVKITLSIMQINKIWIVKRFESQFFIVTIDLIQSLYRIKELEINIELSCAMELIFLNDNYRQLIIYLNHVFLCCLVQQRHVMIYPVKGMKFPWSTVLSLVMCLNNFSKYNVQLLCKIRDWIWTPRNDNCFLFIIKIFAIKFFPYIFYF